MFSITHEHTLQLENGEVKELTYTLFMFFMLKSISVIRTQFSARICREKLLEIYHWCMSSLRNSQNMV